MTAQTHSINATYKACVHHHFRLQAQRQMCDSAAREYCLTALHMVAWPAACSLLGETSNAGCWLLAEISETSPVGRNVDGFLDSVMAVSNGTAATWSSIHSILISSLVAHRDAHLVTVSVLRWSSVTIANLHILLATSSSNRKSSADQDRGRPSS